ncbi:carbohydrate ABC transporter permease [Halococcoides cellulosivorans]|uniref:Carbohydrate ABC transporter permease n=1 Tax=Halococcoides cellulosivorans TaxID=1679096 RepID=A0A2R4X1L2_9EURY|nr:carbohydrate ABC transporter permease [Halococcoides cellulosivorans]AWB27682.1 carbohydrate ABC transporter permease [Halococcoides cellulosivorans]
MSTSDRTIVERATTVPRKRIGLYAVLLAMVVLYLLPLETGLFTAFKTQSAFQTTIPVLPPIGNQFTIGPWGQALDRLWPALGYSVAFVVPATAFSALFGSLAAYGLTITKWRGQIVVMLIFVAGIFIPYQAVLVPLTRFWTGIVDIRGLLGPEGSLVALTITHIAYGIPICTLLFRGHFKGLDQSMFEAARLDGATIRTIYRRIAFPLAIPMFAVTLIYQFTNIWNDLLFALVLVRGEYEVVTMALQSFTGSMVGQYNLLMAGAFITALPTIAVYVLFGKQFAEGVSGGGA